VSAVDESTGQLLKGKGPTGTAYSDGVAGLVEANIVSMSPALRSLIFDALAERYRRWPRDLRNAILQHF
jgi:CO/xanthine dehydrogenase Mo-binding subunit